MSAELSYRDRVSAVALACASHAAGLELKVNALTKQLAKLGCSCTQKTRETDLEAHERFCQFRMSMEDLNDVLLPQAKDPTGGNQTSDERLATGTAHGVGTGTTSASGQETAGAEKSGWLDALQTVARTE